VAQEAAQTSLKRELAVRGLLDDAPLLAEAIVDTVREPLLLLDSNLAVVVANRSFYLTFGVKPAETLGLLVYELGKGQWNVPRLRELLEDILPENHSFCDFKVDHHFPGIGRKIMLLNATRLRRRENQDALILLAMEDITAAHNREEELRCLVREREVFVQEVHHRVKNNLQTIASLLTLQSRFSSNMEATEALTQAGERVQAIARLHEELYTSSDLGDVNMGEYLRNLTKELQHVHGRPDIKFEVATEDILLTPYRSTSLALIANELILNCLKHAFPAGRSGQVQVSLQQVPTPVAGESLDSPFGRLQIQDNGVGLAQEVDAQKNKSLGLSIVRLLTQQLRAESECRNTDGVSWSITFPLAIHNSQEEANDADAHPDR
jgi:two-component sensor histidine kinase